MLSFAVEMHQLTFVPNLNNRTHPYDLKFAAVRRNIEPMLCCQGQSQSRTFRRTLRDFKFKNLSHISTHRVVLDSARSFGTLRLAEVDPQVGLEATPTEDAAAGLSPIEVKLIKALLM